MSKILAQCHPVSLVGAVSDWPNTAPRGRLDLLIVLENMRYHKHSEAVTMPRPNIYLAVNPSFGLCRILKESGSAS
jgi:hypothetical protein